MSWPLVIAVGWPIASVLTAAGWALLRRRNLIDIRDRQ